MPMNARLLRPRLSGDPDALRYIAAVQAADGNTLEPAIRKAITDFVVGCKQDGIWTAIKASCVLMGARTLSGALTPLSGAAPTNNGPFSDADYDRKTGLLGNGTTKYLNSNRANNADGQNNRHASTYVTTLPASGGIVIGAGGAGVGATNMGRGGTGGNNLFSRLSCEGDGVNLSNVALHSVAVNTGMWSMSRSSATQYVLRAQGVTDTVTGAGIGVSGTPTSDTVFIFARNTGSGVNAYAAARLAWYSIGESLSLTALESRVSTLYTTIGSALAPNYADADVNAYINAVEAADGQLLETSVRDAINDFVTGCKADNIWTAIKASCILMGARTLSGALTPLVGTAPTNNGPFVSGDYNRETGLLGNGSTKSINTNRANNADAQNSNHNAVYVSSVAAANGTFIGSSQSTSSANGANFLGGGQSNAIFTRSRSSTGTDSGTISTGGLVGASRAESGSYTVRVNAANSTVSVASQSPVSDNVLIYQRGAISPTFGAHRIAFYSVGESLDLALLDTRVSTLYTAIGAAI